MNNPFEIKDKSIVHYRRIVCDAIVFPWEPMPEVQPANFQGLIDYLRICEPYCDCFGNNWDYRKLHPAAVFEERNHYLDYGSHQQFYIPEPFDPDLWHDNVLDIFLKDEEPLNFKCPDCGKSLYLKTTQFEIIGNETYHVYHCQICNYESPGFDMVEKLNEYMKGKTSEISC